MHDVAGMVIAGVSSFLVGVLCGICIGVGVMIVYHCWYKKKTQPIASGDPTPLPTTALYEDLLSIF